MKYNMSEIMKRAWELAKKEARLEMKKAKFFIGEALRIAWKEAKSGACAIKEWFSDKLACEWGLSSIYSLEIVCGIKETEKAVYALCYTGYNRLGTKATRKCGWIPKSQIMNIKNLVFAKDYEDAVDMFHAEYPEM